MKNNKILVLLVTINVIFLSLPLAYKNYDLYSEIQSLKFQNQASDRATVNKNIGKNQILLYSVTEGIPNIYQSKIYASEEGAVLELEFLYDDKIIREINRLSPKNIYVQEMKIDFTKTEPSYVKILYK